MEKKVEEFDDLMIEFDEIISTMKCVKETSGDSELFSVMGCIIRNLDILRFKFIDFFSP